MTATSARRPAEPARQPAHTPADWWVTADQAAGAARDHLGAAESEPDLLHTLTRIAQAEAAAGQALGAAVNALLAAGHSWDELAAALGHPDPESARRDTAATRTAARQALLARLDHPHPIAPSLG